MTTSKEILVIGCCDHRSDSIFMNSIILFDHAKITHSKLLHSTPFTTTCEKISIVSTDRDWLNSVMNITIIFYDFLLSDVYLFLSPFLIWNKQIIIAACCYHRLNRIFHNMTVVFDDLSISSRPMRQSSFRTKKLGVCVWDLFCNLFLEHTWTGFLPSSVLRFYSTFQIQIEINSGFGFVHEILIFPR